MKVLVDTPIWSYALRTRNNEYQYEIDQFESLIRYQRAFIIGPIRQEILSGYSDLHKFRKLKEKLSSELRQIHLIPVLLTFSLRNFQHLRNALQVAVVHQQFKLQRSHHWP